MNPTDKPLRRGFFPARAPKITASPEIVMLTDPSGARAEAIRALRTHIVAQHLDEGRRALALCSASGAVGCTFTAVNLSVALAQIGVKTILIDANLRTPGVDEFLPSAQSGMGLRQFLQSPETALGDHVVRDVTPGLSVMYAGGSAPNPQELLAGDRFRDLTDACMRDYDATLIDTPPGNTFSDARRISTVVGYSLIVARRNVTFIEDLKTLAAQLEGDHAKVVGTVLNEA